MVLEMACIDDIIKFWGVGILLQLERFGSWTSKQVGTSVLNSIVKI